MVDHGVSERAIEPRNRRRLVAGVLRLLEALHEGILKDVLGKGAIAEPPFKEGEELPVVVNELERKVGIHEVRSRQV